MNQINIVHYIQIIFTLIGLGLFGYGLYLLINTASNADYSRKPNEDEKTYNDRKKRDESNSTNGWIITVVGIGLVFIACILQLMLFSKFFDKKIDNSTSSSEIPSSSDGIGYYQMNPLHKK